MSTTTAERPVEEPRRKGDVAVDAVRNAAHLAHEARLFKTLASDVLEEGVYAARRAARRLERRVEDLADMPAELAHRIRREPLKAVTLALGVGVLAGVLINWSVRRVAGRCEDER